MADPRMDPDRSPADSARGGGRRVALALFLWAAIVGVSLWMTRPPKALGADADIGEASGGRAMEVLERLARGNAAGLRGTSPPRPLGSAANDSCRERILEEIRQIGYKPEVQEAFGVNAQQRCAGTVRNILFRARMTPPMVGAAPREGRSAILCMAHYDSVGAGPGIGDDLAGVAALLEVARSLIRWGHVLGRDVIFLFEDGEEHGLLGAEVFASQHPWAEDVGFVINVEGRGDTGPSWLFETGPGNGASIAAFAEVASAPSTTSLTEEIYRRMPNNTDFSVWRDRGVQGFNFAFIGDKSRYHTPLDDLENLSARSLQHHATNVADALKAAGRITLARDPEGHPGNGYVAGDAVYFDLLQTKLVVYSIRTARLVGGLTLLLALLAAARTIRAGGARPMRIVLAFALAAFVLGNGAGMSWLISRVMGLFGADSLGFSNPAHPAPILVGFMAAALAGVALGAAQVARLVRSSEAAIAAMLIMSGAGLASAWFAPGVSFVFAVPAGVMALAGMLMRKRSDMSGRWARASLSALVVSAACITPVYGGILSAFGVGDPVVAVAPLLLLALLLWPALQAPAGSFDTVWQGRGPALWLGAISLAAALIASVFTGLLPLHSPVRPGHINLVHVQESGSAHWEMRSRGGPIDVAVRDELTEALRASGEKAPVASEAAPSLEVVEEALDDEGRVVTTLRLMAGRPSDQLGVSVSGGQLLVQGVTLKTGRLRFLAPSEEGELVQVIRRDEEPLEWSLSSKRFGLRGIRGSAADAYYAARPTNLVPVADGDHSIIRVDLTLGGDNEPDEEPAETDESE